MENKTKLITSCLLIALVFCGITSPNWVLARANSNSSDQVITEFANRFVSAYQAWIFAPISERPGQAIPLIKLFVDGGNGIYQNDLSQIVDVPLGPSSSILTYTTQLYPKLPIPESVNFQLMGAFHSFKNADDLDLIEVSVKKTMKFPQKTLIHVHKIHILKEALQILAVWVPNLQQTGQEFRIAGDRAYSSGQFDVARSEYQRALEYYTDPYLNARIAECTQKLNQNNLYDVPYGTGTRKFMEKDYEGALLSFRLANSYKRTSELDQKIQECERLIAFNSHIKAGDAYQNQALPSRAIYEYQLALQLEPSNKEVIERINQCKVNSDRSVERDLRNAVNRWNNQDYFEAFNLVYQHRNSGKLSGMHYYMLGSLMADNYGGIKRKMKALYDLDFTDQYMVHSGAMYLFEAYQLGYGDAATKLCQFRHAQLILLGLQHICP